MRFLTVVLAIVLALSTVAISTAADVEDTSEPRPFTEAAKSMLWQELSEALITETSVAISPVIGLSYLALTKDPTVEKYQPYVWIAIALLIAIILKDAGGTMVPGVLKKPLDALEFFLNQGLAILCLALLVPDLHQKLYTIVAHYVPSSATQWAATGSGPYFLAATGTEGLLHLLTLPLSLVIFAAVWLLSNTINALILLSPFSLVDAALKSIKLAALAALAGLSAIHPYLGAALSCLIVLLALYLSGWAFRLYHFGWVFAFDLLTLRHRRFDPPGDHVPAFLDREVAGVSARTYGKISRESNNDREGQAVFRYRPWLLGPQKTVPLSLDNHATVGRGLVQLTVETKAEGAGQSTLLNLPPRYRGHEMAVAEQLELKVVDVGLRRGIGQAVAWIRGAFLSSPTESAR